MHTSQELTVPVVMFSVRISLWNMCIYFLAVEVSMWIVVFVCCLSVWLTDVSLERHKV